MNDMDKKIMLVDGNSLINRGFYAVPLLTNSKGVYTNGVYGFFNIFFKLMEEEKPEYCVVCFDVHAPTFRHKMFEEYKGTRKSMPEELRPQIPLLKELLTAMNIKVAELEGYEADDLLGTLAVKADGEGINAVIVSGDRDLLQIASDTILVRIPKTKSGTTTVESYYAKDVANTYGVTPKEFIEVKALMGDSSDNVPGVPSIGEKTAIKIIQQYSSVENAIANAADVKPKKASENLVEFAEQARLSKTLVTIDTNAPIALEFDSAAVKDMFNDTAYDKFREYEFKSMLSRFKSGEKKLNEAKGNYKLVESKEELLTVLNELNPFLPCAYKLIVSDGMIQAFSFTDKEGFAYVAMLPRLEEILKSFFESDIPKIGHNVKSDIVVLKRKGIGLDSVVFDTMLAGYLINSSLGDYTCEALAKEFLNEEHPTDEEILGKGVKRKRINEIDKQVAVNYCGSMADISYRVYFKAQELLKEEGMEKLYADIEFPLTYVLADMELAGIYADKDELKKQGALLEEKIEELSKEIYWLAGEEFNINSPKQLGTVLFEKLGLKGGKKTKTGWSTAADVLEGLKDKDEIVGRVLDYRTYSKLKSTYCDGLSDVIDSDGRIYSNFNQTVTTTGRISSTEPNLQNIPVRIELGRQLRKVFKPAEDCVFLDADYSQIELRVMAAMSGDEELKRAFHENKDIHATTASLIFKVPFDEVTSQQRRAAKSVNFGIIYGISAFGLSQDIGVSKKEAQEFIDGYFEAYPTIKAFMDKCVTDTREKGYATTVFGRRRYIPEINAKNFMQRSFGERAAMNMPVQGTAADIIKLAMVKVHKRLKEEGLKSRILLQVHDELLLEVPKEEEERASLILREEMENAVDIGVPFVAEVHSGGSWYELK